MDGTGTPYSEVSPAGLLLAVGLGALVIGAGVTGAAMWGLRSEPTLPVTHSVLSGPPNPDVTIFANCSDVAISRDGHTVVYLTQGDDQTRPGLHVRDIGQLGGRPLLGAGNAFDRFFSPDGAWAGFMPARGPLQRVSVLDGTPRRSRHWPGR